MKTKHLLLVMLFAAFSTILFAQDRPQHLPHENSLINRHQHTPVASPEFNIPLNGELESVDELYWHQAGPDAFMPRAEPEKNAQSTNELVYVCDSTFSYTTTGGQSKTIYTRDAAGRVLTRLDQTWNSVSTVWTNTSKIITSYNTSGKKLIEQIQLWDTGIEDWVYFGKQSYTYDAAGKNILYIYEKWEPVISEWVNSSKNNYSYDAAGNRIAILHQNWDTGIDNWINIQKTSYTYNPVGATLTYLNQQWDIGINEWINQFKESSSYDAAGNRVSRVSQKWNSAVSNWENTYKESFSYDASGNKLAELVQEWDNGISEWENWYKYSFTYNSAKKILTEIYQFWGNDNWVNHSKDNNTYDAAGNKVITLSQTWKKDIGDWVNTIIKKYTYDDSGNRLSMLNQVWQTASSNWSNEWKIEYENDYNTKRVTGIYYEWSGAWIPTDDHFMSLYIFNKELFYVFKNYKAEAYYSSYALGIDDNDVKSNGSSSFCSPNPAKNMVNVANHYKKEASLKIYNMNGQQVNEKLLGAGNNEVSVQNLSAGIYLFVLQSENSRIQNKVVVY